MYLFIIIIIIYVILVWPLINLVYSIHNNPSIVAYLIFMSYFNLKGNFAIFYMLAKYVPGDIKYIFTKFYRHISTNNEANRKFVILISNFFHGL